MLYTYKRKKFLLITNNGFGYYDEKYIHLIGVSTFDAIELTKKQFDMLCKIFIEEREC